MKVSCVLCKGRDSKRFCGRDYCPLYIKAASAFRIKEQLKSDNFYGSSPAPFVGRFGYPFVNVGILSPPEQAENAWEYDAPRHWAFRNMDIGRIVGFRSSLINSGFKSPIKGSGRLLEIGQEIGMASKPVDVEISLEQKPRFRLSMNAEAAPTGPNAKLRNAEITSNPKIHTKVDRAVSDTDLKATGAITTLFDAGFDENFLTRLLSVGNIGMKKDRKLVPTRWSITAVDDTLGKSLINEIKSHNEADYSLYFGGYLGNYYLILMFPHVWSYELFETYMPRASYNMSDEVQFTTDYEGYQGRKSYAENCAGGYYAARLPVLERLSKLKRQAAVLVLRFITGEYVLPMGVWVCREAARKAVQSRRIDFDDEKSMLGHAREIVKKRFNYNLDYLLGKSVLLKNIRAQTRLSAFCK